MKGKPSWNDCIKPTLRFARYWVKMLVQAMEREIDYTWLLKTYLYLSQEKVSDAVAHNKYLWWKHKLFSADYSFNPIILYIWSFDHTQWEWAKYNFIMSRNPLTLGVVVSLLGEVDLERILRRIVFQAEMILSNGEKKLFSWNGIRDIHFLPNQSSAVYIIIWGVQTRGFLVCWTLIRNTEKSMRIICESDWNRILWNI